MIVLLRDGNLVTVGLLWFLLPYGVGDMSCSCHGVLGDDTDEFGPCVHILIVLSLYVLVSDMFEPINIRVRLGMVGNSIPHSLIKLPRRFIRFIIEFSLADPFLFLDWLPIREIYHGVIFAYNIQHASSPHFLY